MQLDEVSTTRGSGWVRSRAAPDWLRTHPLPRVVLTRPKILSMIADGFHARDLLQQHREALDVEGLGEVGVEALV